MSDLISRQAAIDAIITLWANKPFGNPALTEIKDCVERVPSAQPEIVRCKVVAGEGITHWYKCSSCNGPVDVGDTYCKHCGARLV